MAETISFKTRVRDVAVNCASLYDSYFVRKSYLILSDAFSTNPYYIVEAEESNYLHLVGVSTTLSARDFYAKCLDGTLQEADFELSFHGRDPKFSKGSIRQKILTLPGIFGILSGASLVEEDFSKNVVRCSFATSDGTCTLGFIATPYARPMTLLRGNELDPSQAKSFSIILSKPRDKETFDNVIIGSDETLLQHYETIKSLLGEELNTRIAELQQKKAAEAESAESNNDTKEAPDDEVSGSSVKDKADKPDDKDTSS